MNAQSRRLLAPEVFEEVGVEPRRQARKLEHDRALFLWTFGPLVAGLVLLTLARAALALFR